MSNKHFKNPLVAIVLVSLTIKCNIIVWISQSNSILDWVIGQGFMAVEELLTACHQFPSCPPEKVRHQPGWDETSQGEKEMGSSKTAEVGKSGGNGTCQILSPVHAASLCLELVPATTAAQVQ